MVMQQQIKAEIRSAALNTHHRDINTVPPFDRESPTTERIAAWFFDGLKTGLPAAPLAEITLWEGPDCSATFRP